MGIETQIQLFDNAKIRVVWDDEKEKYFFSVVDIVSVLTESSNPQTYWRVLKKRLIDEGNETVTNCNALKLPASDGKMRLTDVADLEGILRIVQSIPSKKAEPMKLWLARLGKERIDEVFDPSITVQRAIDTYRAKGYDEAWIIKRIKGIQDRKKLTDVWNSNGVTEEVEYAILTNEIYKEWSGFTAKQYKQHKGLRKESLRDNMTDIEVALADLGEIATRELAKKHRPLGLEQNKKVAKMGGHTAKVARDELEKNLGENVVSKDNALSYDYVEDDLMLENNDYFY